MQYVKIKQAIVEQIDSGMLSPGQKLPAERKLAEMFNTTRITLREALSTLEAEGFIFREDRRGWFISPAPFIYDPAAAISFVDNAAEQQRKGEIALVTSQTKMASKEASQLLSLAPFSDVHQVISIKHLEGRPVCYSTHFSLPIYSNRIADQELIHSLHRSYLDVHDVTFKQCKFNIMATALIGDVASALRATVGSSALVVHKTYYDSNLQPVCCDIEYWRHDAIKIESISSYDLR